MHYPLELYLQTLVTMEAGLCLPQHSSHIHPVCPRSLIGSQGGLRDILCLALRSWITQCILKTRFGASSLKIKGLRLSLLGVHQPVSDLLSAMNE